MPFESVSEFLSNQMMSMYDFQEPIWVNTLYQQHGDQFLPLFQILRSMGRESMVSASFWDAYEDQYIVENFQQATGFTNNIPGTPSTITLTANDVDANGNSYPRDYVHIEMLNGTIARLTNKTVGVGPGFITTFTATPVDATQALGVVAPLDYYWIVTNSRADGTDSIAPAARGAVKRTFYTQIIKERVGAEGGQLANATKFKRFESGGAIEGWWTPTTMDLDFRHSAAIDGAMWIGTESKGLLTELSNVTGAANPIYTTKGLIPATEARGLTYPTGGVIGVPDFQAWETYLVQQRVTNKNCMILGGLTVAQSIINTMVAYLKNTAVDYTDVTRSVFRGDEGLMASMNFNVIKTSKFNFMVKVNENFSNPKTFGTPGRHYDERAIVIPLTKPVDPVSGNALNNIEVKYKGLGSYSRRFKLYELVGGGAAKESQVPVTDIDGINTYQQAELGLQLVKMNQFISVKH